MVNCAPALEEEEEEPAAAEIFHANDAYNEYGLDGRKLVSPEPTTRLGVFWKRASTWYTNTAFYKKKKELVKIWRKWRGPGKRWKEWRYEVFF
jgi:hypothetical protein